LGEAEALKRGNTVGVRDQVMDLVADQGLLVSRVADNLLPTPNTMEHREIKTPEQIAELKEKSPGGYRNLREVVVNELDVDPLAEVDVLLPTPAVAHVRNHDEPIDDYLQRRQDYLDGKTKGMPGASLGVAVRMEMLPTPVASEGLKVSAAQSSAERARTGQVFLTNIIHDIAVENGQPVPPMLPTPTARDGSDGTVPHIRNGKVAVDTIARAVVNGGEILVGTPRASIKSHTESQVTAGATKARLEDQVVAGVRGTISWGKFEPAIRRWEQVIGRPAPSPTLPDGRDGAHRLSKWFTEWLMGVPTGWICDDEIGLTRNQALKAAGNGVVPQQAALALEMLGVREILGLDTPKH
jgi:DNA (cytosine-5)-methyltransferase 1